MKNNISLLLLSKNSTSVHVFLWESWLSKNCVWMIVYAEVMFVNNIENNLYWFILINWSYRTCVLFDVKISILDSDSKFTYCSIDGLQ